MSHSHVSLRSALDDLSFTQGLDHDQLDRIVAIASPVAWHAGAIVFHEGDQDAALYVVEHGRIAIEIMVPGRGPVTILTVGPGEVFGWSSLFSRAQRPRWPERSSRPEPWLSTQPRYVPFATPTRVWATF